MNNARYMAIAFSIVCAGAYAQPFNAHGSPRNKQVPTTHAGSEGRPGENVDETAKQRKSRKKNNEAEGRSVTAPRDSAAPTNSSGVPAENSSQPEQAK